MTLGSPDGVGVFFPKGLYGAINKPTGYNVSASGLDSFPSSGAKVATQVTPYTTTQFRGPQCCSSCVRRCMCYRGINLFGCIYPLATFDGHESVAHLMGMAVTV